MQEKNHFPPRLSSAPFPAYRYVPSQKPHPVIDPEGHSYGKEEPDFPYLDPEDWKQNPLYLYGVDLFNFAYWWEAHEAWENIWLKTQKFDLEGQYLQGLIQMSASLLKLYQGSFKSYHKLYHESQKRLEFCLNEMGKAQLKDFMGLNLQNWLLNMNDWKKQSDHKLQKSQKARNAIKDANFPFLLLKF